MKNNEQMKTQKKYGIAELVNIHREFIEIEYGLISLELILSELEIHYDYEHKKDIHALVYVLIRQIDSLRMDIGEAISKLDEYIMHNYYPTLYDKLFYPISCRLKEVPA